MVELGGCVRRSVCGRSGTRCLPFRVAEIQRLELRARAIADAYLSRSIANRLEQLRGAARDCERDLDALKVCGWAGVSPPAPRRLTTSYATALCTSA